MGLELCSYSSDGIDPKSGSKGLSVPEVYSLGHRIDVVLDITIQLEPMALSNTGDARTKDRSSILIDLNMRKCKAGILAAIWLVKGICL